MLVKKPEREKSDKAKERRNPMVSSRSVTRPWECDSKGLVA